MADSATATAPANMAPASTAAAPPASAAPSPPTILNPAIPVGLHEAALDSPSFRCAAIHFADQVEHLERWLEGYMKSCYKLVHDILALEETINGFLTKTMPPSPACGDAIIDPDHTILALKRAGDGQRDWWNQILTMTRRMETGSADPIRSFLAGELRTFKEVRRTLDTTQKTFDTILARYVAQSKAKEPSSLREDAFAVYETRKAYLKASMDFCQLAPQIRFTLDKMLVRISSDMWREMRRWRDVSFGSTKYTDEVDRIRGWSKEMESTEALLKRELQAARRDVGGTAAATFKPSRELEDYSSSTVAFLGSRGPVHVQPKDHGALISEKHGWLFLRTATGKPARTNWVRRWYYCRSGIFGWLVQGPQGVLQGDDIGVLLCSARPAVQEERRFCFEVKTKSQNITLQAETQSELQQWIEVFEVAKKRAFDESVSRDASALPGGVDPAFAITPPIYPEFSAKSLEGLEDGNSLDRAGSLPVPGSDGLATRASSDVAPALRRSVTGLARDIARDLPREEGESSREHAVRIMQRLEQHRRPALGSGGAGESSAGVAGLISASSNLLPAYASYSASGGSQSSPHPIGDALSSTLAPPTLAKAPTTTFLSRMAVSVSAECSVGSGIGAGSTFPTAVIANYWGTIPWSTLFSTLEQDTKHLRLDDDPLLSANAQTVPANGNGSEGGSHAPTTLHRKTMSAGGNNNNNNNNNNQQLRRPERLVVGETFPPKYPFELRAQHPQFRLLFPHVPVEEKLVMAFNAAWTGLPVEGVSGGPGLTGNGRVFVTPDNVYLYGHQMGLVVAYTLSLDIIYEVTAAPGKDCDFIYLHLRQDMNKTGLSRITIKTFLTDLALLHARLNLLIDDLQAEEPMDIPEIIAALVSLEREAYDRKSPSAESWEEVPPDTPMENGTPLGRPVLDGGGYGARKRAARQVRKPKFQLPVHPIVYEPEGMGAAVEDRHFEISAKACFHVLFGDKSFIFPKLYFERRAKEIAQGPWQLIDHGKMKREFKFKVDSVGFMGRPKQGEDVVDYQIIDVFSDHITYLVTHVKTPWHLPHSQAFKIMTKVAITHVGKSKCKIAVYTKVEWSKPPPLSKSLVQRQALEDARRDAEELAEVATDQVHKLGPHSRTKRAIQVYGSIGQQTQVVIFTPGEMSHAGETGARKSSQMIQPRTLTEMVFETVRSFMESVATSLLMWTFAGVRKIFSVVTAYKVILVALALSVLTNLVFTGRQGSSWWTERRATEFMSRMGVGPNIMISRAIYMTDLNEAALGGYAALTPNGASECYDTFRQIMNNTSLDSPFEEAGALLASAASRARARRLRRTRQSLGSYRHDLLVAMRVVNSVEKEMIQSEWENWLADETWRCEQVKVMLSEKGGGSSSSGSSSSKTAAGSGAEAAAGQRGMRSLDEKRVEALKQWHSEYCRSCEQERGMIFARMNVDPR